MALEDVDILATWVDGVPATPDGPSWGPHMRGAMESLAGLLEAPGTGSVYTVTASGSTAGATDVTNIRAAITAAGSAGTVVLGPGAWYINARITVPQGVNLWGQGNGGELDSGTYIRCTAAGAGIAFGTRTTGGRGGLSGNFTVDGNDIATAPLFIGMVVQRTFMNLTSHRSAGTGFTIETAQNNTFLNMVSSHPAGIAFTFDYSPQANHFYNTGIDSPGAWFMEFRHTGDAVTDLAGLPYNNHFYGGIFERLASTGGIHQVVGDGNGIHDVQVVHDEVNAAFNFVQLDSGSFTVDGGVLQSNHPTNGTVFKVADWAILVVNGSPVILGAGTVFDITGPNGRAILNGTPLAISYGTYSVGKAPEVTGAASGLVSLGTIPVFATGSHALATTLTTIPSSWFVLDPANWEGDELQFRFHVTGLGMTAGDVLSAVGINETDGGAGFSAEFTKTAPAGGRAEAVSAWIDFPAAAKAGYVNVRNATGARGTAVAAFIEVAAIGTAGGTGGGGGTGTDDQTATEVAFTPTGSISATNVQAAIAELDSEKLSQAALDAARLLTTNNQTGTSYTLVLTDAFKVVERNNASANTTTVPPNSSVAFPIGTVIEVWQQGAGTSTVVEGAGVTFVPPGVDTTLEQGLSLSLRKRGTNEWAVTSPGEAGGGGEVTQGEHDALAARLGGLTFVKITEAAYDALGTKDANTVYLRTA